MDDTWKVVGYVGSIVAVGMMAFAFFLIASGAGFMWGILAALFLLMIVWVYGLVAYTFFQYRYTRQSEFLQLLSTAGATQTPLAPAMWAFANDRPRDSVREIWTGTILFFLLPGY